MFDWLISYYTFTFGTGTIAWTNLLLLIPKTILLIIVITVIFKVLKAIVKPFVTGFKREMSKDNNKVEEIKLNKKV